MYVMEVVDIAGALYTGCFRELSVVLVPHGDGEMPLYSVLWLV